MTSRLTFNFGIRWDYFGVVGEKDNLFYQLDPTAATNVSPTNQLYDKDYNNFAPRLAFAYDVTGKGRDRDPRRLGPVLRRLRAGHFSGARSV